MNSSNGEATTALEMAKEAVVQGLYGAEQCVLHIETREKFDELVELDIDPLKVSECPPT